MNRPRVLLVDDEPDMLWVLRDLFAQSGYEVATAADGVEARRWLEQNPVDVVLSDVRMPGGDGVELLRHARALDPDVPVVLLSAVEDIATAVGAMKLGAYDYLAKPFDRSRLLEAVRRGAEKRQLAREVADLRQRVGFDLGTSVAAREVDRMLTLVARHAHVATLLVGESGVGKEIAAREIHRRSDVRDGPFVAIDCGALPEALMESELFGHCRGAFTGADRNRTGLFVQAHGGTLFLDEIGNLPVALQTRLLRALQERAVVPVGGDAAVPFDARLVCATNVDLDAAVQHGTFRLDLFHRIAELRIELPPLRARADDIPVFARRFLAEACAELGKHCTGFAPEADAALRAHSWPGNLRELRNAVRRAVLLGHGDAIEARDLDLGRVESADAADAAEPLADASLPLGERLRRAVDQLEARILRDTLASLHNNKAAAARALKIDYTTLHRKLKRHGLATMADAP
ncbi:MAG: sigma-54 dependent transcriptional regulator [Planctomycetota bacterium]